MEAAYVIAAVAVVGALLCKFEVESCLVLQGRKSEQRIFGRNRKTNVFLLIEPLVFLLLII